MTLELFINIYLSIAAFSGFATASWMLSGGDCENVDSFWDWFIYNLLWIKLPIKSFLKYYFINFRKKLKTTEIMSAEEKADALYLENYMILMEYGEDYSEECLISILSIKFGVKQCDDMINEFTNKCCEFQNRKFWEEVKQYLLEM